MNSEEGMSLAKMAVTVLLVVLVIGAVVALVYKAYSWFTQGSDKLGDQVVSIDKSSYSQFDDAQVSGVDVLSALKTYRESDIAIVVCNSNNMSGTSSSSTDGESVLNLTSVTGYNYCSVVKDVETTGDSAYQCTVTQNDAGVWEVPGLAFEADMVTLQRNTNFSPTTTNGNSNQYVKQSGSWYANLIYSEETNDICGILFRQLN